MALSTANPNDSASTVKIQHQPPVLNRNQRIATAGFIKIILVVTALGIEARYLHGKRVICHLNGFLVWALRGSPTYLPCMVNTVGWGGPNRDDTGTPRATRAKEPPPRMTV